MKNCFTPLFSALIISFTTFAQGIPPVVTGNLVVCEGQTTVLTASVVPANPTATYQWFDSAIGGNLLFSGNPYTTAPVTVGMTIYVSSIVGGIPSLTRTPVVIAVVNNPDIVSVSSNPPTACPNAPVTLIANSFTGANNFAWFNTPIGGSPIHTGVSFTTSSPISTTYYVASIDANGCYSNRSAAPILVIPNADIPIGTANPPIGCPGDNVALTGTSPSGNTVFKWYDAATGGNLLHTGQVYNFQATMSNTYFLETTDANGCSSLRTPVPFVVAPNPDVPTATATPTLICPGQSTTLQATSLTGSTVFNWYNDPIAGTLLATGSSYTVSPANTTTYYVESYSGAGCPSVRTAVNVIVSPNLDVPVGNANPPVSCPGNTVTFSATSPTGNTQFIWYNAATGGNAVHNGQNYATTLNQTTTFYVSTVSATGCESVRTPVTALQVPNMDVPTATSNPATACPGQSVTLQGNSANGSTLFNWYDAPGGNLLHVGQNFVTTVSATTTFYLTTKNNNGCESLPVLAPVVILPNLDIPAATATPPIICNGQSSTLSAVSATGNTIFRWYNDPVAGTLLYTGANFTVAPNTTTIYYVSSENNAGCASARVPVSVVVSVNLDVPLATANPVLVCPGEIVTFSATSANGSTQFYWYDSIVAGNQLSSGSTFATAVNPGQIFYLESANVNGCRSVRTPATAIVTPNLDVPIGVSNPPVVCTGDTVVLSGTSINGSNIFNWYSDVAATNLIGTGANLNYVATGNLSVYLQTENANGCKSIPTPVAIVVAPNLDVPVATASPLIVCPGDNVTLTATSITGSTIFHWYDGLLNSNLIYTGNPFTTTVSVDTTFFVQTENANGCRSVLVPVAVLVLPNVDVPIGTVDPLLSCPNENVLLEATSLTGSSLFHWYDQPLGGQPQFSGQTVNYTTDSTRIFFLESEDANGCRSIRTPVTVVVGNNYDDPLIVCLPGIACLNTPVTITALSLNGSLTYNWYDTPNGGNIIYSGPVITPLITDADPFYLETVNASGCASDRKPFMVPLSLGETPMNFSDTTVCVGTSANLSAQSATGLGVASWFADSTSINPVYNGNNVQTGPLQSDTTFYVVMNDSLGCPGERKALQVFVQDNTPLSAPNSNCFAENSTITYVWEPVNKASGYEVSLNGTNWSDVGLSTNYIWNNPTSGEDQTLYIRAYYSGPMSCVPQEGISTTASCRIDDLVIPYNTFSPNNDGVNDTWNIGEGVAKYNDNEVIIFNRVGQEVFRTTGYDNLNKVFTGEGLADGSYYYVVKIPSKNFSQTGYVMITR